MNNRYMMRGVSAAKEDVHNAIKNIDKGLYPQAFCKIIPDILGGDLEYCNIMHADGAGTKICTGLHVLEGDGRSKRMAWHCTGCYRNEYRRLALCGCGRQHPC